MYQYCAMMIDFSGVTPLEYDKKLGFYFYFGDNESYVLSPFCFLSFQQQRMLRLYFNITVPINTQYYLVWLWKCDLKKNIMY